MAINIFEGARRIAKLVAAIWLMVVVVVLFSASEPYISVSYVITGPGQPPKRNEAEQCGDDGKEILVVSTNKGTKSWVTLCFQSEKTIGGIRFYRHGSELRTAINPQSGETVVLLGNEWKLVAKTATNEKGQKAYLVENVWVTVQPSDQLSSWDSPDVMAYTAQVKKKFILPQADEQWIDRQWWFKKLKELGLGALVAIGGLLFLFAFSWTVGWVARGFMGIPRGQDHRIDTATP